MDRELSSQTLRQRKIRTYLTGLVGVAIITSGFLFFRSSLKTSISANKIRTATAELGPIENTLTASGVLIPEFEQVISSPIKAEIKRVIVTPGTTVKIDQPILELDKSQTINDYEKQKDQLDLKRNAITQLRIKLQKSLYELEVDNAIKDLNIGSLQAKLNNTQHLKTVGGATQEEVNEADFNLKTAELEKKKLANELKTMKQSVTTDLREMELQASIQEKDLRELETKLKQAEITAKRNGVVTWVNENIGSSVSEGEQLAKIADLNGYSIEGSCSDTYSEMLRTGMSVIVKINEIILRGSITNIRPTIKNNILTFIVALEKNNHPALRPNMKVEVFIVTNASSQVVRVANGPAFSGKAEQSVFVLENGVAHRRQVQIGASNFDFVELKNNIKPGETIIISDMSEYEHLNDISITK
ncbi:efflux RND transporter periplasmic adaptor subunit [Cytophagaceae bacterium YF14B1]|uniref:Efflux RND transporter periplasmic adaptor subunit n=1 Tax=Xanthocytophaga flava TaxID=3048013 RepID=A0AAE3QPF4_9BACT|nr:efflux RND transporter periplasmic adaptor subunit [Xanthocytophaga flavus]MDJ1480459.1 efflux RND transporter periplasmic adaptor subunit [Xanthocytophaga flavus]